MRVTLMGLLLASVLTAACGGGGGNGTPALEDTGAVADAPGVGELGEPDITSQEVADTIEGFIEAITNGRVIKLETYLSETCTDAGRDALLDIAGLAVLADQGEFEVSIDPDLLTFDVIDGQAILKDQPEEAMTATVDGRPIPNTADGEGKTYVIEREDGVLRIVNCGQLAED